MRSRPPLKTAFKNSYRGIETKIAFGSVCGSHRYGIRLLAQFDGFRTTASDVAAGLSRQCSIDRRVLKTEAVVSSRDRFSQSAASTSAWGSFKAKIVPGASSSVARSVDPQKET